MASSILVNIGSDDGLLVDDIKPLVEQMLTNDQLGPAIFTWWQFHQECLRK